MAEELGSFKIKIGADNSELNQKLEQTKTELEQATKSVSEFGDNIGILKQRYRELSRMSLVGKSAEEIQQVEAEMASLRDAIGDYQAKIDSLAKDPFQKAAEGVQAVSTMMAGAAGAATLFGGEQEKLNALMQKTVALIAIAQAAQTAADFTRQNAIGIFLKQKTSEIALRVKEALTIGSVTAATTAETTAKTGLNAVQRVMVALQTAWNKAVMAAPIGWIIAGIAALVAVVIELKNAFGDSVREQERFNAQVKATSDALKIVDEDIGFEIELLRAREASEKEIMDVTRKGINEKLALMAKEIQLYEGKKKLTDEDREALQKLYDEEFKLKRELIVLGVKEQHMAAEAERKRQEEMRKAKEEERKRWQAAVESAEWANKRYDELQNEMFRKAEMEGNAIELPVSVDIDWEDVDRKFELMELKGIEISEILSDTIERALEDTAAAFAEGIGLLVAGEANMGDVFRMLGEQVANFAESLGKALIAAGVASDAFKKLIHNPFAAIAAGAALVATAAIVRAKLKAGPSGSASSATGSGGITMPTRQTAETKSEWSTRNVYTNQPAVVVSGTLRADGSQLVAVIESENRRRNY